MIGHSAKTKGGWKPNIKGIGGGGDQPDRKDQCKFRGLGLWYVQITSTVVVVVVVVVHNIVYVLRSSKEASMLLFNQSQLGQRKICWVIWPPPNAV